MPSKEVQGEQAFRVMTKAKWQLVLAENPFFGSKYVPFVFNEIETRFNVSMLADLERVQVVQASVFVEANADAVAGICSVMGPVLTCV